MKKTKLILLLMACCLLLSWSVEAKTTIRFIKWPGANYDPAKDPDVVIVEQFNKTHPDIEVQLEVIADYFEKLMVQLAGGVYPDVLKVDAATISEMKPMGILEELTPYLEKNSSFAASLWPIATSTKPICGGIFAIPTDIQPNAIYYNVDYFAGAGILDPNVLADRNNWHWDTFLAAAKKLTVDTSGDGTPDIWGYKGNLQNWPIFVEMAGGKVYSDDGRSLVIDRAAMEGLEFMRDLIHTHRVWTTKAPYYTTAFPEGSASMILATVRYVNIYRDEARMEWDTALIFGRTADQPYRERFRPGGLAICSQSPHKDAAWEFIQYFLGYESQLTYVKAGLIPMNRRAAASPELLDPHKPPKHMNIFLQALERGIPNTDPVVPKTVTNTLNTELNKVWNRGEPVQTIIEGIRPTINALLKEY
ncbi:MAG TPA: extracellular solute-binding protein [Firmicutes bacterium]|nr:extracellular solute-binding protein [Bacillota bacterium]